MFAIGYEVLILQEKATLNTLNNDCMIQITQYLNSCGTAWVGWMRGCVVGWVGGGGRTGATE